MMGLVDRKLPMMRLASTYKVARARSVSHRSLFKAMEARLRAQIGHVGTIRHEMANNELCQFLKGG